MGGSAMETMRRYVVTQSGRETSIAAPLWWLLIVSEVAAVACLLLFFVTVFKIFAVAREGGRK
jgi:uncharacterized membrane-anchored protein